MLLSPVFEETPAELATGMKANGACPSNQWAYVPTHFWLSADASQVTENSMHPLVEPPANHADVHKAPTMQLNSSSNRILCTLANDQEPHSGPIGPSMPPAADSEVAATSEVDPAAANADADNANQPMSGRIYCQTSTPTTVHQLARIPSFVAANCALQPACMHVQCVFTPKTFKQDEHL